MDNYREANQLTILTAFFPRAIATANLYSRGVQSFPSTTTLLVQATAASWALSAASVLTRRPQAAMRADTKRSARPGEGSPSDNCLCVRRANDVGEWEKAKAGMMCRSVQWRRTVVVPPRNGTGSHSYRSGLSTVAGF